MAAQAEGYPVGEDHLKLMLRLNSAGAWAGECDDVHAMTDISGFGLVGHACEMATASDVSIEIDMLQIPMMRGAVRYAMENISPSLGVKNLEAFGDQIAFGRDVSHAERSILADPQTNGGLLIAADAEAAPKLIERLREGGDAQAAIIGAVRPRDGEHLIVRGASLR
jgi:selenide,water dikinase